MMAAESLLDRADGCSLLHRGSEADVYEICGGGRRLILKWYKKGNCFNETSIANLCRNPVEGVYRVLEHGNRDGIPYLLYQYVDGVESSSLGRLPVLVALQALRLVARALEAMAKNDLHHGDLNPSNVILRSKGDALEAVLIDCGIEGPGALAYAAPERFRGKSPDVKSDLYSLGLLLFRWVSGSDLIAPCEGENSFDWFASRMAAIDSLNPVDELYGMGSIPPSEISALAPIWSGLLKSDPLSRVEDFDELDEIIEIAMDRIASGKVAVVRGLREFAKGPLTEKMRQIVPPSGENSEKCAFPYKKAVGLGKISQVKVLVLCGFGLILLIVVLVLAFVTRDPGIDEVGSIVLQKSRSLELAPAKDESESGGDLFKVDSSLLKDLPTPETGR